MKKIKGKTKACWSLLFKTLVLLVLSTTLQPSSAYPLSIEEERALGERFVREVRRNFDVVDDKFVNEYINGLGKYLASFLETRYFPFNFYIINDRTLNAFAGPGGHIFFFTGLIDIMGNADELAAVLSHEIAHISARHLQKRLEENRIINVATIAGIVAGILLGGEGGAALMSGTMAAGAQARLAYSREDERQADQLGVKYVREAGFDPAGMIPTLKKIQSTRMLGPDSVPPYLLTHPLGPERISNIEIMVRSGPRPRDGSREVFVYRKYFPHFKTVLRAKYSDPEDAEAGFREQLEKNPGSTLAHLGLGLVYKRKNEHALAIKHLKEALRGEPGSKNISIYLGEEYQLLGQDEQAVPLFLKAMEKDRKDARAMFLLAKSYQNLEQYEKAIDLLKKLYSMGYDQEEVFYNLGISYGRLGRLAQAHYYFGIYFRNRNDEEKALFHLKKAEKLARDDLELKNRVRKAMEELPEK
ncbi:MAG: M48 family metalloprotease [Deltaproteobacteria bacterium]|nr:M48 family metalloprotease [Deltaproteobacteria bacterium]